MRDFDTQQQSVSSKGSAVLEPATLETAQAVMGDARQPDAGLSVLTRFANSVEKQHVAIVLLFLLALELVIFGTPYAKTGFFLDDWLTLFQLKFGPQDLWGATQKYLFNDPRVLIRPIEAPYFAILYKTFGFKAAGYHFVNGAMEVLSGFFLYLSMMRMTRNKALAFMASALFIVNPTHDATHYWMVCSSATLSMMLFLASFWSILKAVDDNNRAMYVWSGALLTISLFNYESCIALPLAMVVGVGLMQWPKNGFKAAARQCVNVGVFLLIPVVVTFVYQRYLSPLISYSWVKRIEGNGGYILPTIGMGLEIQTPWALAAFIKKYLLADFFHGLNAVGAILLSSILAAAAGLTAFFLSRQETADAPRPIVLQSQVAAFGLLFAVLALAVFGLSSEYTPLMITLINRINLGASVGASLITAALVVGGYHLAARVLPKKLVVAASCLIFSGIMTVFALSDRVLSNAWLVSTVVQNRIREVIAANASQLKEGDGIILLNCPRYVLWAPIADGTWDLQAMLRVASNNDKIYGTSVSDRLVVSRTGVKDFVFGTKQIADLPFKSLYSLEPHTAKFQPVPSAEAFIDAVDRTTHEMGIAPAVVQRWRDGLKNQQP